MNQSKICGFNLHSKETQGFHQNYDKYKDFKQYQIQPNQPFFQPWAKPIKSELKTPRGGNQMSQPHLSPTL